MHCLPLDDDTDICVTVKVKLIQKGEKSDDLAQALEQRDRLLQAQHLANGHEKAIASQIKEYFATNGPS